MKAPCIVFIVEVEPLLDVFEDETHLNLVLFGKPGAVCMLQSSPALGVAVWTDEETVTFSGPSQMVERVILTSGSRYYRLIQR